MNTIAKLRELDRAGKRGRMKVATYHDVGAVVETYIKEHGRGDILFCGRKADNTPDIEVAQVFAAASNALTALLAAVEKSKEFYAVWCDGNTTDDDIAKAVGEIGFAITQLDEVEL